MQKFVEFNQQSQPVNIAILNTSIQSNFDLKKKSCSNKASSKVAITVNIAPMRALTSVEEREDESRFENTSFKQDKKAGKNSNVKKSPP